MENENQLTAESNIWEDYISRLFALSYNESAAVVALEQKIYAELSKQPNHIEGLITLMFAQIMQGNRPKAKAIAYRIWEIGGQLETFFEMIYIENLLNLGLIDMASILLKPRFEKLKENLADFYPVLAKFAILTGSTSLLSRLGDYSEIPAGDELLFELIEEYTASHYSEHFKNIQKIVLEHSAEYLCAYEYNLYDDLGFPELEIVLYVGFEPGFCLKMQQNIENKIEAYWKSSQTEPLYNLQIVVENIHAHPAWEEQGVTETTAGEASDFRNSNWQG